ncbi:MAG: dihydropteroate synthase [Alphaproteobacteria bacterium]
MPGPKAARTPTAGGPAAPSIEIIPSEILQGAVAATAVAQGRALWLAGGPHAFAAAVRVERSGAGEYHRQRLQITEIDAGERELLSAPRASLAGVPLDTPRLMGIVNASPDSFADAGAYPGPQAAIAHGKALIEAGADFLDIGGESTRPGADPVAVAEEIARVVPVIEGLKDAGAPLSIDTRNAETMAVAVAAGAAIVNDISALGHDPRSTEALAELGVPAILCHSRGTPATMREHATYGNVSFEVCLELRNSLARALAAGVPRRHLLIDPGFGFAKKPRHNARLLAELAMLHGLGCAILVGASGKSFERKSVARQTAPGPGRRIGASVAAALAAIDRGAQILRVHDVAASVQALAVRRAIVGL